MSTDLESLDKRISRLEFQNQRLRWSALMLVVLVFAAAAWAQTPKDTIVKAQKFELRDDAGRLRAELSILNGESTLRFFDREGIAQSLLSGNEFNIYENEGDILATFSKTGLEFGDGHQKTYARITAHEEDRMGKLQLNDFRTRTYVVVTAKELAKLRQLDLNSSK